MNLINSNKNYFNKLFNSIKGIKVLLLDNETLNYLSSLYNMTTLLKYEIFLIENINNINRNKFLNLNCLVLLKPTSSSIRLICNELLNPHYKSYHLYFTNTLNKQQIDTLAKSDKDLKVNEIIEIFSDFYVINDFLFTFNFSNNNLNLFSNNSNSWNLDHLHLCSNSISAVLLSLKKKPIIRYQNSSNLAFTLSNSIQSIIDNESNLYDFRPTNPSPVLLICDRRNDPVTPLLSQWTYQAMIHELIGLDNGKVDLSYNHLIPQDQRSLVLSSTDDNDPFYSENLYANFGDLGANVKAYVSQYQSATQGSNHNPNSIQTISDMKNFIESYPQLRKFGGNVSKHVTLLSELSKLVEDRNLLKVSELEQSLASNESHNSDLRVSFSLKIN